MYHVWEHKYKLNSVFFSMSGVKHLSLTERKRRFSNPKLTKI